ncbi:MAG: EscE/YscE/SsaE family type III secretion system needle protein co-chaperone [Pseudomonadota bacterium]
MSDTQVKLDPSDLMNLLLNDKTGEVRDAAKERVSEIERSVKRALDGGVSPTEFQVLSKVHNALGQAVTVVDDSWSLVRKFQKGNES